MTERKYFIDMEGLAVGTGLPTKEELQAEFPHSEGCSRTLQLTHLVEIETYEVSDPRIGKSIFRTNFLRCDECGVKQAYR
jgi:hypothetical protein